MAIAIPRREPWYKPRRLLHYASEGRRLPILPVTILMFILIIPAVFAPFVAPQEPLKGALRERLRPPVWQDDVFADKTVVEEIEPGQFSSQITFSDAERKFKRGEATYIDGLESSELAVGRLLNVRTQRGGSSKNLLGTDKLGRDILSRIIYGSRVSIIVAGLSILIGAAIGSILGIAAAYYMGWADAIIMRLVDISLSIPIILLALVLVATIGPSFKTVILVLSVLMWARFARLARGEALSIKAQDYISRARVAGASDMRIMFHHIFPNVFNSLVVLSTLWVGFVIILEATLSFLGAGIPRPTAAWGLMVADGRELIVSAWWVAFFPGMAILLTVMGTNLLGDWLRDKLDPKQRQV